MTDTASRGVDYRLLVALMCHGLVVQTLTGVLRVTTSYRVLELGLPVVWLGAISATFALLPVFLAVFVGRYIDRGHDARTAQTGSALMLLASIGLAYFSPNAAAILGFTSLLGVGHLCLMASHQMLCVRAAADRNRDAMFGNFLVVNGIGQGLGPYIVGYVGGAAKIPDTTHLFEIGVALCVISFMVSLALPVAPASQRRGPGDSAPSVRSLFAISGFTIFLIASIVTITAQDLIIVYLPLLGTERGIDSGHIGQVLTVRSGAAIVSRLFYARVITLVGRVPLTFWSMTLGGCAFALLAAPLPLAFMYADAVLMGFGLGIATTLSLTSVVDIVPANARATALSLRITGNRIGQVTLPFAASLIAATLGAPGVLFVIGASLCISAASVVHARRHRR